MEEKNIDLNTSLEDFLFQIESNLPTGRVVHNEIGVSWDIIAQNVYYCSRNDIEKYADYLPREFYYVNQEEAAKQILSIWDDVISKYIESIPNQDGRSSEAEKKWRRERPKYERALNFAVRFRHISDAELKYAEAQDKDADDSILYGGEYDILDVAYDKIAHNNKGIVLERLKPVLEKVPIEQFRRLTAFYDGYTAIAHIPLVALASIMSEGAKLQLKKEIDGIMGSIKEHFQCAVYYSKALTACNGIRQGDNAKLRGGQKSVWEEFTRKTEGALYLHALRMAVLVLKFSVCDMKDYELEMFMEYALFLGGNQQKDILQRAKQLISSEKIDTSQIMKSIEPFISETMREEEQIERYLDLEIANSVYDS